MKVYLAFGIIIALNCYNNTIEVKEETKLFKVDKQEQNQDIVKKGAIKIDVEIVDNNLYRGKLPCMVNVRITNKSKESVLVNKRLEVGYRNSFDRELFLEVFIKGTNKIVSEPAEDYQRDPAMPQDYVYLEPEVEIAGTFDLCEWYSFPLELEGDFEMVVYYQADESYSGVHAEGILSGIFASDRIPFKIMK